MIRTEYESFGKKFIKYTFEDGTSVVTIKTQEAKDFDKYEPIEKTSYKIGFLKDLNKENVQDRDNKK